MDTPRTVLCPRRNPLARLRLFLFHHAGGSSASFYNWHALFPGDWEVNLVDHPGRGRTIRLPLLDDLESVLDCFAADLRPLFDRPFAFFGHSMGAMVCFELAKRLLKDGAPAPCWIGVSGKSPDYLHQPTASPRHLLDDDALIEEIRRLGGTPDSLLASRDYLELLLPIARADFRLVETWSPPQACEPLPVPLSAFGGLADESAPPDTLDAWRRCTVTSLGLHTFDGGHFYLFENRDAVAARIRSDVGRALHGREAAELML